MIDLITRTERGGADPEDQHYCIKHLPHLRYLYSLKQKVRVGRYNGLYLPTRGSETFLQTQRRLWDLGVKFSQVPLCRYLHPNLMATLFLYLL